MRNGRRREKTEEQKTEEQRNASHVTNFVIRPRRGPSGDQPMGPHGRNRCEEWKREEREGKGLQIFLQNVIQARNWGNSVVASIVHELCDYLTTAVEVQEVSLSFVTR